MAYTIKNNVSSKINNRIKRKYGGSYLYDALQKLYTFRRTETNPNIFQANSIEGSNKKWVKITGLETGKAIPSRRKRVADPLIHDPFNTRSNENGFVLIKSQKKRSGNRGRGKSRSGSRGKSRSGSRGKSRSGSRGKSRSGSRGKSRSGSRGKSRSGNMTKKTKQNKSKSVHFNSLNTVIGNQIFMQESKSSKEKKLEELKKRSTKIKKGKQLLKKKLRKREKQRLEEEIQRLEERQRLEEEKHRLEERQRKITEKLRHINPINSKNGPIVYTHKKGSKKKKKKTKKINPVRLPVTTPIYNQSRMI
jgi:hypothetical protein